MKDFFKWLSIRRFTGCPIFRLNDEERAELAELMNQPVMQKALIIAEQKRPPLFSNDDSADVRLAMIRGWEMHRMALLAQVNAEAKRDQKPLTPTYPFPVGSELNNK